MTALAIAGIVEALAPLAKELAPAVIRLVNTWRSRGDLTPEQIAELVALNEKTEADYVREAGGRE